MSNEELIAEARQMADRSFSLSVPNHAKTLVSRLADALEAAQADLAARDAVIAAAFKIANTSDQGDSFEPIFTALAQSPADALAAVKAGARNAALAEAEGAVLMDSSGYGHGARVTTRAAAAIRALRTTPTEGASE